MTTNSPNPVVGDVQAHQMPELTQRARQAVIEFCIARIAHLERCIKAYPGHPAIKVDLLVQQVALAALTAEPVYQFIVNNPDKDGYIEWADCNPDYFSKEPTDKRRTLYTALSAQLLRPVELPMVKTARSNWSTWNWIEHLGGSLQNGKPGDYIEFGSVYAVAQMLKQYRRTVTAEVISEIKESLRKQGYEVKND